MLVNLNKLVSSVGHKTLKILNQFATSYLCDTDSLQWQQWKQKSTTAYLWRTISYYVSLLWNHAWKNYKRKTRPNIVLITYVFYNLCLSQPVNIAFSAMGWSLVQLSPTACLYVCDQETPKREAKGPSWTISACEWMTMSKCCNA
jgi:hypothetical protein